MNVRTAWRMLSDEEPPDMPERELRELYSAKAFSKILSFGMKLERTIAEYKELMARLDPPPAGGDDPVTPTLQ